MRSSTLFAKALLLATSTAQYFSYDDFSDEFSLNARDEQYGYDMEDLLEMYARDADVDSEDDLMHLNARNKGDISVKVSKNNKAPVDFKETAQLCINNGIVETSNCKEGQSIFGTLSLSAKIPPGTKLLVSVKGIQEK